MTDTNSISQLTDRVCDFSRRRDWEQFHDPKNLAMALAAEVGELNSILRWVPNSDCDEAVHETGMRQRLEAEIGDVAILLLQLCERTGIDFGEAVVAKLQTNSDRYPEAVSRGLPERPS
jgi:NTP pyrophosphatase (non-canonical NTP hydrolase)